MRVAIVHDYLFQYGGAEKVVETWLEMYPDADVYTSFLISKNFKSYNFFTKAIENNKIKTTWLQLFFKNKQILKFFKHLFWLYPLVMSSLVVKDYDIVLISSTYCGKNVRYKNCKKLIHYCHSPVRFLHGLVTETDHKSLNSIYRLFIPVFTFWLKWLDLRAVKYLNNQKCLWVANSHFIQETIKKVYKTESLVIYPPTKLDKFLKKPRQVDEEEFYFCHGRISFHKRLDLAIKSCLQTGKTLKISGSSALEKETDKLKEIVNEYNKKFPNNTAKIQFLGRTSDQEYINLMSRCKVFIFPGKEDAGITPIEAFASGTPVIAYKAGGALEYLKDDVNGVFFDTQSVECMVEAIQKFEQKNNWDTEKIRESSYKFSEENFKTEIEKLVVDKQ